MSQPICWHWKEMGCPRYVQVILPSLASLLVLDDNTHPNVLTARGDQATSSVWMSDSQQLKMS